MGLHYHVRVSVDGKKIRSAGGDAYRWVTDDIETAPEKFLRDHICHVPKDGQPHSIECICIKRHRSHANRTIIRHIMFLVQNQNGNPIGTRACTTYLGFNLDYTSPVYKYLHKLSAIDIMLICRRNMAKKPLLSRLEELCAKYEKDEEGGTT